MRSRVSDAGASRAGGLDVAVAEVGGNGRGSSGSTSKPVEAKGLGLVLETVLDQSTVAVVMLAVWIRVSSSRGGESANNENSLHLEGCLGARLLL